MAKVVIYYDNQTKYKLLDKYDLQFKNILSKSASRLRINQKIEINLMFFDEKAIKKLNNKYLHKNLATDVISFKSEIPLKSASILASIVICPKIAEINAKKNKISFMQEIENLIIHGFMHILDYNHFKKKDINKWQNISKKLSNIIK